MYHIYVIQNPKTGRRLIVATDDWLKFQQRPAIMPLLIYGGFIVVPVMTCKKREYRDWLEYQIRRHLSDDPRFGYNHARFGLDVSGTRT
jgi:hypothetical protein